MTTTSLIIAWPTDESAAQRLAVYLPLHGTRVDLLPGPWPEPAAAAFPETAKFPKPRMVLRELTAWFGRMGPQPMAAVPALTQTWLSPVPNTHPIMQAGVPWLRQHSAALWPAVAVTNLLAMYEAIQ